MVARLRNLLTRLTVVGKPESAPYVPYLVPMIGTPKYTFEGLTNFTLFLKRDKELTEGEHKVVDKYLNKPLGCSNENCIYRLANSSPYLIFSEVKKSYSDPDLAAGQKEYIAYKEVSIIVPVVVEAVEEGQIRKYTGWFLPMLFVDGPDALATQWQGCVPIVIGREMYGLPKVRSRIEFEYSGTKLLNGSVSLYNEEPILTVEDVADHPPDLIGPMTHDQRHKFAEAAFGTISPNRDFTRGTTVHGHDVDLKHVGHGNPLIGLRQIRDVAHLQDALYQDVVESPYVLDPDVWPSPLGNKMTVTFDLKSGLFNELHLQEKYEIEYPTRGAVYPNITAVFGNPADTVVRRRKSREASPA